MKTVLSIKEVNRILVKYLLEQNKIEYKDTDVSWRIDQSNVQNSFVVIDQEDDEYVL